MKYLDQQMDPDDYFAETRMSFGDHIEDLRKHLLRAVYGFVLGMVLSLFIGKIVLNYIASPVEDQLAAYWDRYNQGKLQEIREAFATGDTYQGKTLAPPRMVIDLDELKERL